ncbi:MAG TPA: ABC transporter ATP-binding protein [Armatimonadota bacterium]|nr:ABC transporter ATP-binding protein [Armatimonadota bacterium]
MEDGRNEIIRLEGAAKSYMMGEVEVIALHPMNLVIYEGEFIVMLGPSGSGKTTLLNLIGGIDTPTSGKICFKGVDLAEMDEDELTAYRRDNVGFVFQFFNLVPTLTARENIEFVAELVKEPRSTDEVLASVGLAERADHFPSELSGGEQQRVAIARALVKNPPLLLADEPTGNLDYETGKKVLKLMRDIARLEGVTVILVTHNSAIASMADRVIHLRSGDITSIDVNPNPIDPEELKW